MTNSPLFYHIQSLRERGTIPDNIGRLSLLQELEGKIQQVIGTAACSKIEKQIPVVAEPWWVPPNIRIADTAVKEHDEICKTQLYTHMKVYTDGIDIQGRGGAAAWEPHRRWKILVDIGPSDQFSVYGAELFGIWIALDMGVNAGDIVKKLTIFTENQASITSSARPRKRESRIIICTSLRYILVTLFSLRLSTGLRKAKEFCRPCSTAPGGLQLDRYM